MSRSTEELRILIGQQLDKAEEYFAKKPKRVTESWLVKRDGSFGRLHSLEQEFELSLWEKMRG